uniref:Uncharacterized protein n=1 Tax=Avena sativa TaxID=4498 RepID=A0ACD5VIP0_AVESA
MVGVHEIGQYLYLWHAIAHTTLTSDRDRLVWKWTPNGVYTAQSCYKALFHRSMLSHSCRLIWQTWAPPSVKVYHWLAMQNRCWTAERLASRDCSTTPNVYSVTNSPRRCTTSPSLAPSLGKYGTRSCPGSGCLANRPAPMMPASQTGGTTQTLPCQSPCVKAWPPSPCSRPGWFGSTATTAHSTTCSPQCPTCWPRSRRRRRCG